jgi:hypothetical protein
MKFIENIVTDKVMERAKRIFLQDHFGWFYNSSTSKIRPGDKTVLMDEQTKESIQFTHKLYTDGTFDSEYVDFIMKIMKGLEEKEGIVCTKMLRAKCNLLPQDASYGTDFYHPPHVDIINPTDINYSLIYYVNNSDGDTILFNEQFGDEFDKLTIAHRQTPKEGCALLFKSGTYHASSSPMLTNSRVIMNIVFESDETKDR